MTLKDIVEIADKNECEIYYDDLHYERVILNGDRVDFYEIQERHYDNEKPDFSIAAKSAAKIVDGVAHIGKRKIELRKSVKFPIA